MCEKHVCLMLCLCISDGTDGESGTSMERVKEGGTAEDLSTTVPPSIYQYNFQAWRKVCVTQQ